MTRRNQLQPKPPPRLQADFDYLRALIKDATETHSEFAAFMEAAFLASREVDALLAQGQPAIEAWRRVCVNITQAALILCHNSDLDYIYGPTGVIDVLMTTIAQARIEFLQQDIELTPRPLLIKRLHPDQAFEFDLRDGHPKIPLAAPKAERKRLEQYADWLSGDTASSGRRPKEEGVPVEHRVRPRLTRKEAEAQWRDKHPFDRPTKEDIAREMGISRSTLYRRSKERKEKRRAP